MSQSGVHLVKGVVVAVDIVVVPFLRWRRRNEKATRVMG